VTGQKQTRRWGESPVQNSYLARNRAIAVISQACSIGVLLRAYQRTCVDCGADAQVYDHRDYSKPYEVDPVCQKCNLKRGRAKWSVPELRHRGGFRVIARRLQK
jgi:hypothetical protein